MKKRNGLILSCLILCASWMPALAADTPLVLGILEIRGLDSLANSAFELSKAAGNPMPKELVSMLLYGRLFTMPGMGIPGESTVRVVAFDDGADAVGLAVLLPVVNEGADYLSGLGQSGWKNESETPEGILHYVAPAGSGLVPNEVYFLKRGATLVAAKTAEEVRKAEAVRATLPPILPVEGDVAIEVRPAALAEAFAPQIAEQMDKAFKDPNLPANASAMGDLYAKAYLYAAKQLRECVLGIGLADDNLNFHVRVAPRSETTLARWFETVRPPAAATAVVALPDALAAETLNLGDLNLLAPAYFRFMEKMMAVMPSGLDPAAIQNYLENEKACYAQMTGDFGIALLPPTQEAPLRFVEYVALKDSSILRTRIPDMIQIANKMMKATASETGEAMPFQIDLAVGETREYREIAIDKIIYAFQLDQKTAAIWPKAIPTKFEVELAWVPGGVLGSVGGAAMTEMLVDRALDGATVPLTERPAWQALYPEPDARLVDMAHLALFDVLRAYLGLADDVNGSQLATQVPDGAGNLETASYVMDGLMTRIRFSLADIAAIGAKAKEVQAKAMADMQQQMEAQGAMPFEVEPEAEPMDDLESSDVDGGATGEEIQAPDPAGVAPEETAPAAVE